MYMYLYNGAAQQYHSLTSNFPRASQAPALISGVLSSSPSTNTNKAWKQLKIIN